MFRANPLKAVFQVVFVIAIWPTLAGTCWQARADDTTPISLSVVPREKWTGEPYCLAGKRLVFTNWYFVRPGGFAWVDRRGQGVTANRSAKAGLFDAHFRRADDAPFGIRIVVEKPERRGPIILPERPWEAMGLSISCIIRDGKRFRAWGSCQDRGGKSFHCYLESPDGVVWQRPDLGMVEFNGTKDNNLIPSVPIGVFIDASAPASERYKGVSRDQIGWNEFLAFKKKHPDRWEHRALRKDGEYVLALFGYVSPDGLHWKRLAEPFTVEHSDTQLVGTYNPVRKKYVIYTRNWFVGPRARKAPPDPSGMSWLGERRGSGRRSIGITESDHFGDFPLSRLMLVPRPDMAPSELLYTNGYTTIPGAPDHHLLFPTVWDTSDDSTRLEMASSHDGRTWNWMPGGTLMDTGTFGRFDGGSVFWNINLIELSNGDFALPYTGYTYPHKYPRGAWSYRPGYAIWPKGRLVALAASDRGEFTTVSLMPPGRKLRINAVTKRAGHVLVAVTRRNGTFLPGHSFDDAVPVIGDQYRARVRWKRADDLGTKLDEPICLRFRMLKARIYALDFEPGD